MIVNYITGVMFTINTILLKKYCQLSFLRIYLTGQFKIFRESYSSRYRVIMIGNYITGVMFTINTILLKKCGQLSFLRIYLTLHVNLKYLKNS